MKQYVYRPRRVVDGKSRAGRFYRGRYRLDGDERDTNVPLRTTDKRVAEKKLAAIVAEVERERYGLIPPAAIRDGAARPLLDHLADFVADLRARGRSRGYVSKVEQRVQRLCRECGWATISQVTPDSFRAWRNKCASLSPKTQNEYLAAAVSLLNWLQEQERCERNPLAGVRRVEQRGRKTFERRAFTVEELARLVAGPRGWIYLLAAKTGLRRNEIATLTWGDVELDEPQPFVAVRAENAKNRRSESIPLDAEVAALLRGRRGAAKPRQRVVAKGMPKPETFRADLAVAGIRYQDEFGRVAHFHGLRMTYATLLAREGIGERVRQELMRHRDPRQTNQTYTDASLLPKAEAVAKLPRIIRDAPLDAPESAPAAVASEQTASGSVTKRQTGTKRKSLERCRVRRDESCGVTTRHEPRESGGGGNRTPVPKYFSLSLYVRSHPIWF